MEGRRLSRILSRTFAKLSEKKKFWTNLDVPAIAAAKRKLLQRKLRKRKKARKSKRTTIDDKAIGEFEKGLKTLAITKNNANK